MKEVKREDSVGLDSMRWSLKELYSSFEGEDFLDSLKALEEKIKELKQFTEREFKEHTKAQEKLEKYLELLNGYVDLQGRLRAFASLSFAADAKDQEAKKYQEVIDSLCSKVTTSQVSFLKWLKGIDSVEKYIEASDLLKEYSFYLQESIEKSRYLLGEKEEEIISLMKLTGSGAFANMKNELTANHTVEIELDGKKQVLGINKVKNMAFSRDGELRKKAYYAEKASNERIAEPVAASLNAIKGEVITLCRLKGYASPLEKTLIDSRMDQETLDVMLKVVKESLKDFQGYFLKKAELLGHKGKLPYYDIMAPIGKDMEFSYEEARDYISQHFSSFSEDMGNLALKAFGNRWIDAEVREGKRGGAFCMGIHGIKESRILSSYNGSFKNVCTLAHELGHGYHGYVLSEEKALNSSYPMPLAETASIFAETIVRKAALKKASDEEALAILGAELVNSSSVIVDIYARFLFEKAFFERRKESQLSLKEIKDLMLWAEQEAYGDAIEESTFDEYAWIHKVHYYFAERNFYNFPYTFGLLFAKGLYSIYLKEGETFKDKYRKLLTLTGKANIYDVAKFVGIDIHKEEFWKGSMDIIKEDIERFLKQ